MIGAERRWTGLASLVVVLSSRLSLEIDFVGVVKQPIADRISDRGFADVVVPTLDGCKKGAGTMKVSPGSTAIGRLMEVVSWHGTTIRNFRGRGTGKEDVITTEVFQALDLLPRSQFLAAVLEACEGSAVEARQLLVDEAEGLRVEAHADRFHLNPTLECHQSAIAVDPDVVLETPEVLGFVEAKRPASAARFQQQQLARQYFVLRREAGSRLSCLILLLGSEPPVRVRGIPGKIDPARDIRESLPAVYDLASAHAESLDSLQDGIEEHLLWITWQRLASVDV